MPSSVVGVFQQSSMTGKGTVGFVADPVVALPLRTQADHQMVVVRVLGATAQASTAVPTATG